MLSSIPSPSGYLLVKSSLPPPLPFPLSTWLMCQEAHWAFARFLAPFLILQLFIAFSFITLHFSANFRQIPCKFPPKLMANPTHFGLQQFDHDGTEHQQKDVKMPKMSQGTEKKKGNGKRKRRESGEALIGSRKEQRREVLEQLRAMVGCEPGCGQFEIVQRVIHRIGQLSGQLQQPAGHITPATPCSSSPGPASFGQLEGGHFSAALISQLIASISVICRRKKAQRRR